MRINWTPLFAAVGLTLGASLPSTQAAAPTTAQGLITGKEFTGISGTAVANLTNSIKFPNNPDRILYFPYFEWNATGDIVTPPPNDVRNQYGGQIVGYFYPPTTGDYTFYLAADDNAVLYLSPTANAADKKVIARETTWSNPREYTVSGGNSDLTAKDTSQYLASEWVTKDPGTGAAKITLQAGQPYYIEALFKEGDGGDNLSVAVLDPTFTIDSASPIPGQYLSTDRTSGPVSIETQPQSQTVAERGSVTFRVIANGTPPYSYQWRKGGADILDATNLVYTATLIPFSDNNAQYTVVVTGAEGAPVTSQPATITVTPDTAAPTAISSKAMPGGTQVVITFSEPIDPGTGATAGNYTIASSSGPLNVSAASVSANQVTLTTAAQTIGTKYTITINGVRDSAATPNTVAANTTSVFLPTGAVTEQNGLIVFEAENFNRNLGDLWVRTTSRGTPSGGAAMIAPNGSGNSEAVKLEYDLNFAQAGTYYLWARASADNGSDDSFWIHIDGDGDGITERPFERDPSVADPNSASLSGFQPQADFVWTRDSQGGPDPMTIEIPAAGPRAFAIALREDGAFVDKIILTTDANFTPSGFGPAETRQGAPGLPTVSVTAPTAGQTFSAGANITLSANAAGQSTLNISRVQFTANGVVVGEDSSSPFSVVWTNAPAGVHGIRAVAFDEIGQSTTSDSVAITVGSPAPHALLVTGVGATPNASDAGIIARLQGYGWQVTRMEAPATTTASADGKQLIIVSSTVTSGDVAAKFQNVAVPVIFWEQAVQDDFLTTDPALTTNRGTVTGQTQINVVNTNHPLARGINLGLITTTTNAQDYTWGMPNSNAVVIATIAADPNQAVIYGYDKGAILANGTTPAPEKRVLLFSGDNGFAAYTPEALQLFDNAVQWASGIRPITGARIAWISFHPADNDPWTAADTAGFTNAPDVGYTQLLRDAGHDVVRFRTTGTPDTNVLNTFDLVIISRSVPSGDYQDPPETLAWNRHITVPTMVLGGYINRASRLGLNTGSTIPDTAGPIKLTITDTNHPVFQDISLDATGTMVNDYTVIATYTNQPQRGISVVTEPPAGDATVLATVGTAVDPTFGGMIIAEYAAGAATANARGDLLGGKRLVFLTGSRENAADATTGAAALTSEGAGIFDLTTDGATMFLNAVDYMTGASNPDPEPPTLSITRSSPTQLSIQFQGTLQSTTSLSTPNWSTAATTSPHNVSATEPMRFYRAVR